MRMLDFRSDTVTKPSAGMREAMAAAEVGDDVMGEDPTVNELEARSAELLGFDAALFVPTGTMANQIASWIHTGRDGQIVCESRCHIALYEAGAASLLSGAGVRTVEGNNGVFTPAQVREWVYPDDPHFARTKMVSLENTHNWSGGRVWPTDAFAAVVDEAHDAQAKVHVDGARIFNAAEAAGQAPAQMLTGADSAMACLSKGLGAPVGSVLVGDAQFIHEARRVRKALGGGMRQAGILAAAGIYAYEHNMGRIVDDHALAQQLGAALEQVPGLRVNQADIETNMVLVDVSALGMNGPEFCDVVADIGVGCLPRDNGPVARFVTHLDVGPDDVVECARRLQELFAE